MDKIRNVKILILEDDLQTVEKIFECLRSAEIGMGVSFGATVIPDYIQVEELINKNPQVKYDILLLDRDCFLGGSFHVVNLDNFDKDKVISISSVPEANQKMFALGVSHYVLKDFSNLDLFAQKLKQEIQSLL